MIIKLIRKRNISRKTSRIRTYEKWFIKYRLLVILIFARNFDAILFLTDRAQKRMSRMACRENQTRYFNLIMLTSRINMSGLQKAFVARRIPYIPTDL